MKFCTTLFLLIFALLQETIAYHRVSTPLKAYHRFSSGQRPYRTFEPSFNIYNDLALKQISFPYGDGPYLSPRIPFGYGKYPKIYKNYRKNGRFSSSLLGKAYGKGNVFFPESFAWLRYMEKNKPFTNIRDKFTGAKNFKQPYRNNRMSSKYNVIKKTKDPNTLNSKMHHIKLLQHEQPTGFEPPKRELIFRNPKHLPNTFESSDNQYQAPGMSNVPNLTNNHKNDHKDIIDIVIPEELSTSSVIEIDLNPNGDVSVGPPTDPSSFYNEQNTPNMGNNVHALSNFASNPLKTIRINKYYTNNHKYNTNTGVNEENEWTSMHSGNADDGLNENMILEGFLENNGITGNGDSTYSNVLNMPTSNNGQPLSSTKPGVTNINHIYIIPHKLNSTKKNFVHMISRKDNNENNLSFIDYVARNVQNNEESRVKRSSNGKSQRIIFPDENSREFRVLDYDGWHPVISHPMANDPTIVYKPPELERVHFGKQIFASKPSFPVVPENPPVYVVTMEGKSSPVHSIYGTEKIEYFHVDPKSKALKVFNQDNLENNIKSFAVKENFNDKSERSDKDIYDYVYEYDYTDYPGGTTENLETSPSKNSFVLIPPDRSSVSLWDKKSSPERGTLRYEVLDYTAPKKQEESSKHSQRTSLFQLLKGFKGFDDSNIERYEGSASENVGKSILSETPPEFIWRPNKPVKDVNIEEYITDKEAIAKSPWFLIETRTQKPVRNPYVVPYKVKSKDDIISYKTISPVPYIKNSETTEAADNPYLNKHMNSHKPQEALVANSLSELLQIFRYTSVTDSPSFITDSGPSALRGFRYTKIIPDTTTQTNIQNTKKTPDYLVYKYSPTSDNITRPFSFVSTTTALPEPLLLDKVAETNSLDGYLFSDTIETPEFVRPGNKAPFPSKNKVKSNSIPFATLKDENVKKEIAENKETSSKLYFKGISSTGTPKPLNYIIHRAPSKVRVYGIRGRAPTYNPGNVKLPSPTYTATLKTTTPIIQFAEATILPMISQSDEETFDSSDYHTMTSVEHDLAFSDYSYDGNYYDAAISNKTDSADYGIPTSAATLPTKNLRIPENFKLFSPSTSASFTNLTKSEDDVQSNVSTTFLTSFSSRLPRPTTHNKDSQGISVTNQSAAKEKPITARPVFYNKRQQAADETAAEDTDQKGTLSWSATFLSQPFEYLSQLMRLNTNRRTT